MGQAFDEVVGMIVKTLIGMAFDTGRQLLICWHDV
jgi:hypothetical protein